MFCILTNMVLEENIQHYTQSCTTLLKYNQAANDKPSKEITLGLFLDLSNAFDPINVFMESEARLMIGSTVISPIDINEQNSIRFNS